jgi:hypothetical protein
VGFAFILIPFLFLLPGYFPSATSLLLHALHAGRAASVLQHMYIPISSFAISFLASFDAYSQRFF